MIKLSRGAFLKTDSKCEAFFPLMYKCKGAAAEADLESRAFGRPGPGGRTQLAKRKVFTVRAIALRVKYALSELNPFSGCVVICVGTSRFGGFPSSLGQIT